jgi:NTP pyrophosphatase (non-canonical NTP hydrolase)
MVLQFVTRPVAPLTGNGRALHTIEAYEVADVIGRGDLGDLRDLLLQVGFHARGLKVEAVNALWDAAKAAEKAEGGA